MKRFIVLLTLISALNNANAQQPPLPVNYTLETPADFRQYETNVIGCIKWLAETPRNISIEKRRPIEDFLVKWIYGCPYVNIVIESYAMKLSSKNADLLLSFMFGYTLYQLQHPGDKNLVPANVAGLNNLLKDYQLNIKLLNKDPAIEYLLELQASGKLSDWVQPQLGQKKLN